MIIGYDASRAFIKNRTGTENYSYQLLLHLAKIDHKNTYYVYMRPDCCHPELDSGSIQIDSGSEAGMTKQARNDKAEWPANFKFVTIPYPKLWTQVGLAFQTLKDPLDILFVPAHTLPLIRKPGLKTVMTVHDLGAEFLPNSHQLKQRLYLNFMTKFQLKSATKLIAVSRATKADIIKKTGISANKISVIYEGFSEKTLKNDQKTEPVNSTLKYYDLEKNNYFLFVGTIQPRKNLERLIKAYTIFLRGVTASGVPHRPPAGMLRPRTSDGAASRQDPKQSDEPVLILAGSKGWMSDEIYDLPKKLGIENQVKFLGYVPDKHLPALYSNALAFLFPSLFEGFGLPILEAYNYKCPVLTSNTTSLPEVAGSAAILVNPESEEEIAQGILKLFNDQKISQKLIKAGIAQLKKFSWDKCAKETLALLENL